MAIKGRLDELSLATLVQQVCQSGRRSRLRLHQGDQEASLYFDGRDIVHAVMNDQFGEEVVHRVLHWEKAEFYLEGIADLPSRTIERPWSALLMAGLQRIDEERSEALKVEEVRSDTVSQRKTTEILNDFLSVPGISTAVVVGRDGFVIEAAGGSRALNLDALGASLAYAINGIERMGTELKIRGFRDLFVEHEGALIMSRPVGDAIIALVAPDASQLGIIRYQIKPLVQELATYF